MDFAFPSEPAVWLRLWHIGRLCASVEIIGETEMGERELSQIEAIRADLAAWSAGKPTRVRQAV
jgi:hypothetical protein